MTAITTYQNPGLAAFRSGRSSIVAGLPLRLTERGKIKIGNKGATRKSEKGTEFQPPQKLDHFIITTVERGKDGNFEPDQALMGKIANGKSGDLKRIPIRLLFDDVELNMQTRYVAYKGKSVWCEGNGETAMREGKARDCTCECLEPGYGGPDPKCKPNGRLQVIIDGADTVGGVWVFRTTSWNSISGLLGSMMFIQSATGGKLANLPLDLTIQPKTASAPNGSQVQIYVVGLEYRGGIEGLRKIAYDEILRDAQHKERIAQVHEQARLLIEAPVAPSDPVERADVVEEFYPDQAATDAYDPETGEVIETTYELDGEQLSAAEWLDTATHVVERLTNGDLKAWTERNRETWRTIAREHPGLRSKIDALVDTLKRQAQATKPHSDEQAAADTPTVAVLWPGDGKRVDIKASELGDLLARRLANAGSNAQAFLDQFLAVNTWAADEIGVKVAAQASRLKLPAGAV